MPIYGGSIPYSPLKGHIPERINGTLNASSLSILYVILVHDHADFAARIVTALMEPQHTFVYHVDLKAQSTQQKLLSFASNLENVLLVDDEREVVTWGAFSIVNATLAAMRIGWYSGRHFDYMILLSGTSYPIQSNDRIRETLAKTPNAVYMDITPEPSRPAPDVSVQVVIVNHNMASNITCYLHAFLIIRLDVASLCGMRWCTTSYWKTCCSARFG